VLGVETLRPGEEGWLQVELVAPVIAMRGDRYILRRPSPGETLGGGFVVDPHPPRRHKRFSEETIQRLETLAQGSPAGVLMQAMLGLGAASMKEVITRSNLEADKAALAFEELLSTGQIRLLDASQSNTRAQPDSLVASQVYYEQLSGRALEEVKGYHQVYPLRRGMPREELKSRLKVSPRIFNAWITALVSNHKLHEIGPFVSLPSHEIRFTLEQERAVESLLARIATSGYSPPTVKECQAEVGEEVYAALVELGRLVQVSTEVVFSRDLYDDMVHDILALLEKEGTLTAAQARDHFNTSRRYVLALLEHLDATGLTVREGDIRKLRV
jgi:selenocysteine-specific elongation factor